MCRSIQRVAATIGLLIIGTSGCPACEEDPLCIPWIREGETYTVEVLDRFQTMNEVTNGDFIADEPYSRYAPGSDDRPCGDKLGDVIEGGMLELKAVRALQSPGQGPRCRYVIAEADVPGTYLGDGHLAWTVQPFLMKSATIQLGTCKGKYEIGLMPVREEFRRTTQTVVLTDYMLVRGFAPISDEASCADVLDKHELCMDNWYVRVRDESGALISQDFALPADAGP